MILVSILLKVFIPLQNGLNALHLAAKDGHISVVDELLKRGATVDAATKKGWWRFITCVEIISYDVCRRKIIIICTIIIL